MKSKPDKLKPGSGDLRERALRLLARREHSRAELARKLETAGFERARIDPLLDDFEKRHWLSDQRFAESYVADHRARAGSVKLAHDLRERGVSDPIIAEAMSADRDSELDRAREVWKKKFGTRPADAADKARQMRFLQSRGFTQTTIHLAIKGADTEE